ncbi:MAG: DDE-type integrase/transposase/recombinase [Acetobacteraceae bacterium]|nr:DDE-type integrase/transposase/recombinase [Acetobacteraceae bacterium]MBV8524479.1 DDE-type integrase/transposase/recombinase [Acetobacteraceae bacterium]
MAAKPFFGKALAQAHTVSPRTTTVDKNPGYPRAAAEMKRRGEMWRFSHRRQCKYLNNIVEQDHRRINGRCGRGSASAVYEPPGGTGRL